MKLKQAFKLNTYDEPVKEVVFENDNLHIMEVENQYFCEHPKDVLPEAKGFIIKVRNNIIKNTQIGSHGLDGLSGVLKPSDYADGQIFVIFSDQWESEQAREVAEILRDFSSYDSILEFDPDNLEQAVSVVDKITQAITVLNHLSDRRALIKPDKIQELKNLLPHDISHLAFVNENEQQVEDDGASKEETPKQGLTPEVLATFKQQLFEIKAEINKALDEKLDAAMATINPNFEPKVEPKDEQSEDKFIGLKEEEIILSPLPKERFYQRVKDLPTLNKKSKKRHDVVNPMMNNYDTAAQIVAVADGVMGMQTGVGEEFMILAGSKFDGEITAELQDYVSDNVFIHEKVFTNLNEAKQALGIKD